MSWNDGRGGTAQFISFFQNTHSERWAVWLFDIGIKERRKIESANK
jgi:hypothetical protein